MPSFYEPLHWSFRGTYAYFLLPFSWFYFLLVQLRIAMIKPQKLPVPLICIGNNTVGGAGKTPTAIAIAEALQAKNHKVAFISRGYKGQYHGTLRVDSALHDATEVGDEPLLLARTAPTYVSRRRKDAAARAIHEGATIIIMDDGLQNPSLQKDFTLMVVDGKSGFGNGFMMPAGPCREPQFLSARRAHAILIIGAASPEIMRWKTKQKKPVFEAEILSLLPDSIKEKKLHAFAGIARPEKFFDALRIAGGNVVLESPFPDHHPFTFKDLERLETETKDAILVCTEKDYVRLPEDFKVKVTPIQAAWACSQQESLIQAIEDAICR